MFSSKKNTITNTRIRNVLALLLIGSSTFAGVPNWSVNSGSYQYSMSFISAINIQGAESVNGSDMVGAFVKGQCRGIAKPTVVQATSGRHLAYLLVYSNVTQGDTIVFKVYDSKRDSVYSVPDKIAFQSDVSKGVASDPYVFYTNNFPVIKNQEFNVNEHAPVGTPVGNVTATDADIKYTLHFHVTGTTPDFGTANNPFVINESTGQITVSSPKNLEFETNPVFTLKVVVEDEFHLKDSAMVKVHLINQIENTIKAFNMFSPNADGYNDFWEIENVDLYKGFKLTIFDSAGEIVFEKTDYKNDWSGTYKGKAVPEGMYYYSLKSPDYAQDYKGAITIMR